MIDQQEMRQSLFPCSDPYSLGYRGREGISSPRGPRRRRSGARSPAATASHRDAPDQPLPAAVVSDPEQLVAQGSGIDRRRRPPRELAMPRHATHVRVHAAAASAAGTAQGQRLQCMPATVDDEVRRMHVLVQYL